MPVSIRRAPIISSTDGVSCKMKKAAIVAITGSPRRVTARNEGAKYFKE